MGTSETLRDRFSTRRWSSFTTRIVLPAVLAVVLFVLTTFLILIPIIENELLEGKKETTQELTRAAVSILDEYHTEELSGRLTREQAQSAAIASIERLRYGADGKDYFWITDMQPTMIMHPYLPELNGRDLSTYEDQRGKTLFVAFVDEVREDGSGFVDYYWQWKDDPDRVVPKLSYVELFQPWQWVIGTGIYLEDVHQGIARVQRSLTYISLAIALAIALLLFYGARQSLKIEKRRAAAEQGLKDSHERYRALVEAATEGILMVLEGKCAYSNKPLLDMLGYTSDELAQTDIAQLVIKETHEDRQAFTHIEALLRAESAPPTFEGRLRPKEGGAVDLLLTATPVSMAGRQGFILVARSLTGQKTMEAALDESRRQFRTMSDSLNLGVFRSMWGRKAGLLEVNPAMRSILRVPNSVDLTGTDWLERVIDVDERTALVTQLNQDKTVQDHQIGLRREDGGRADVSLSAVLIADESGHSLFCDGIVKDITRQRRSQKEQQDLIAQLQTSLFFLQESIGQTVAPVLSVDMSQSISRAAALMTKNRADAVFVTGPDGELMGIVTDHDFRKRVVAESLDHETSIHSIMTAPVASISQQAPIYEALIRMQEGNLNHLAVVNDTGKLVGGIRLRDLVQYQQSSPVIITDSIRQARSLEKIVEAHDRLPSLVKALVDFGAETRFINRTISGVSDITVQRLVAMATEKLGPPPVRFAFLTLGSEGREEQTLLTDQDNALLYEDPDPDVAGQAEEYFVALGTAVCDWLDQVGYTYCDGGVMAKNPRWNLSRSVWRQQFSHWIHNADPQELLELNMLFDFRCVIGEQEFARELRAHVFDDMESYPLFFLHFAQNALLYKPPLTLLGHLHATSRGHGPKALGLKEALMPVVNFARLYALKHRIDATNTLDRLSELRERGILSRESYEEIVPDYETLMSLRLRRQAVAIESNLKPSNLIPLEELTPTEEAKLKRLFSVAGDLRKKIGYDFLGGIAGL